MKILPEHVQYIKERLSIVTKDEYYKHLTNVVEGRAGRKPNDLARRLRWDFYYVCVPPKWTCDNIYPYANDDHIDTLLRKIFKEYEVIYASKNSQ